MESFPFRFGADRSGEPYYSAARRRRRFHPNPSEHSELANAIRFQFHDRPFAIMETPFVLRTSLEKNTGATLDMIWRYEQFFYGQQLIPGDGWGNGFMTHEGSTGLIQVAIKE
jgi:hypothetical protein